MKRADIADEIAAYTDGVLRARRAYYRYPKSNACADCGERPRYRNEMRCNPCKYARTKRARENRKIR